MQAVLLLRCLCPGDEQGASSPLPPQLWDLSHTPLACSENGAKSRPAQSWALGSTAGCGARLARCTVNTGETKGQPPSLPVGRDLLQETVAPTHLKGFIITGT